MDFETTDPGIIHMNRVWREAMAQTVCVEKFATFILNDGQWDVQLWSDGFKPVERQGV